MERWRTGKVHGAQRRGPARAWQRALPQRAQALLAHDAGLSCARGAQGRVKETLPPSTAHPGPPRAQCWPAMRAGVQGTDNGTPPLIM